MIIFSEMHPLIKSSGAVVSSLWLIKKVNQGDIQLSIKSSIVLPCNEQVSPKAYHDAQFQFLCSIPSNESQG
jgi:hypothetical protein